MGPVGLGYTIILIRLLSAMNINDDDIESILCRMRTEKELLHMIEFCKEGDKKYETIGKEAQRLSDERQRKVTVPCDDA